VKSLKCNELISLSKFHNDLGQWTTPHLCTSVWKQENKIFKKKQGYHAKVKSRGVVYKAMIKVLELQIMRDKIVVKGKN
jgi:hypothetical protein